MPRNHHFATKQARRIATPENTLVQIAKGDRRHCTVYALADGTYRAVYGLGRYRRYVVLRDHAVVSKTTGRIVVFAKAN